jgi:Zn-dependent oligopeptidase
MKFVLRHDAEGALGTMYLDLFSRPGKFGGAAHFVVRCGKRLHENDGGFERAMGGTPSVASAGGSPGQSFQLPIIVLVTNYAPPTSTGPQPHLAAGSGGSGDGGGGSSSSSSSDPYASVLMTPQEVETLFHEFGHALHSLLSRTEFQHLSGTRGALDFVEVPSHLMEYYARDFRVVRTFARHHVTSEPMPEELWARVQSARTSFAALDLQAAVVTSLYDQALFGSAETVRQVLEGGASAAPAAVGGGSGDAAVRAAAARPVDVAAVLSAVEAAHALGDVEVAMPGGGAPVRSARAPVPPSPDFVRDEDMVIPLAATDALRPMPRAGLVGDGADGGGGGGGSGVLALARDSTALLAAVHARYAVAPHLAGSKWQATFAHAATYGGGYYTYVYAAALSSALWSRLFAADPFSRAAGELYWREVLAKGAGADPVGVLTKVLGGPPTMKALLKEVGVVSGGRREE